MRSSEPLERVRALVRSRVPHLDHDRYLALEIAFAAELVAGGALAEGAAVALPSFSNLS
jgi:histidine ammonia-lyase